MLQETLLTAEGLKELEEELEQLKTVGRKEAASATCPKTPSMTRR